MKKIILMLAVCGALATMSAQTQGSDINYPSTNTTTPNTSGEDKGMKNNNQGGTGQEGSDQGTNGNYQGTQGGYGQGNDKGTYNNSANPNSNQGTNQNSGNPSSNQGNNNSGVSNGTYSTPGTYYMPGPNQATAQNNKKVIVPEKVKQAFKDVYQDVKATWSREGENFKARFKVNSKEREETIVVYDKNGDVVRRQWMLKKDAYPVAITEYYKDKNTGVEEYDVWEVSTNDNFKYYVSQNGKITWFDDEGHVTQGTASAAHQGKSTVKKSGSSSTNTKKNTKNSAKSKDNKKKSYYTGSSDDRDMDLQRKP